MAQALTLSDREQYVLKTLIEHYIADGVPVGSRTLSKIEGINCSPATIRNVMGDLEALGLLHAPHTSAGRVPTQQAYRIFVDHFVGASNLKQLGDRLDLKLPSDVSREKLIQRASEQLSGLTQMAGLVTLPSRKSAQLKQVEFLPLSERRILVILVNSDDEIENRVIQTDRDFTPSELTEAANYINQTHAGKSFTSLRDNLREDLLNLRENLKDHTQQMLDATSKALESDEENEGDFALSGQTNLMSFNDLSDVDRLRELFEAFNSKRDILRLLERSLAADGVQIFIGQESGFDPLAHCSVVTAPYQKDGEIIGVLGVVGPTRMAYEKVIPTVDITSKLLTAALSGRS
ncbi:MAG: heat-inducible transcription repressor HrcA [Gammaproteobacteria bacterium]|nr:heat-inducible transcription repressor HrcA [Gammaproteobacteria bacterium]